MPLKRMKDRWYSNRLQAGVQFLAGPRDFSLLQWVLGTLSLEVKWSGYEADHSPPTTAEVKNCGLITSTLKHIFMAWCLIKHRGNFTFFPKIEVVSQTLV
jgi:predicted dehydrogenase